MGLPPDSAFKRKLASDPPPTDDQKPQQRRMSTPTEITRFMGRKRVKKG